MQDDDRPTPLVELAHDVIDKRSLSDRIGEVGDGGLDDLEDLDFDGPPSPTAHLIEAGIDGKSVDPGVEPIGVAEAPQVAPGPEHGLLDGVARELAVSKDQASGRVQPRDRSADELSEGVMIAIPRAFHERSLVHGHLAR